MPELPEVETVRRGLLPVMEGRVIERADVNRPDLRWPFPADMAARLTGARVERLWRRSKYILADMNRGETLIIHLGMSGRMQASGVPIGAFFHNHPAPAKHDHVVLHMEGGGRVTFNDPRRFGAMDLTATQAVDRHKLLHALGPEPFGNGFNEDTLAQALQRRSAPIKAVLLDQRVVAGLGNIYVCEVLFRAKIAPDAPANTLPRSAARRLVPIVRDVLAEAIAAGGSSLRDHRRADGALGYFQHSFKVYGRAGQACVTTGCHDYIARTVQSGRSTFYCPTCQSRPCYDAA